MKKICTIGITILILAAISSGCNSKPKETASGAATTNNGTTTTSAASPAATAGAAAGNYDATMKTVGDNPSMSSQDKVNAMNAARQQQVTGKP